MTKIYHFDQMSMTIGHLCSVCKQTFNKREKELAAKIMGKHPEDPIHLNFWVNDREVFEGDKHECECGEAVTVGPGFDMDLHGYASRAVTMLT